MERVTYDFRRHLPTVFGRDEENAWIESLFGMLCGNNGQEFHHRQMRGMFHVKCDSKRYEGASFVLADATFKDNTARLLWKTGDNALELESLWDFSCETGVISRKDTVRNTSGKTCHLNRCFTRFVLSPGRYEVYAQDSRWSNENEAKWLPLHAGGLQFGTKWGRTSEGGTPYLAIRECGVRKGVAFHVVPKGNWAMRVLRGINSNSLPFAVVELGISDEDLNYKLAPGEKFQLPEILVQGLPEGEPHLGAPHFHRYITARIEGTLNDTMPVAYNTWFDSFDNLEVERLRRQLKAALELGCEMFVIDAGWFGGEGSGWSAVGDWREKQGTAFRGKMRDFADEVRAAGLGFGIWIEPERFDRNAPVVKEHPEWFVMIDATIRLDFTKKAAREYQMNEISRLIETYDLAYIKVDMNAELGYDGSGKELADYFEEWYGIVDRIKSKYPRVYIQNCASGAMRTDISTLFHFDGHFPSDNAHPVDTLRICQGLLLRLPPGRIIHWIALWEAANGIGGFKGKHGKALFAPIEATWNSAEKFDASFMMASALTGSIEFTGDVASLAGDTRETIKWYVDFFKSKRRFILSSACHLLTPIEGIRNREGWIAFQLQAGDTGESLVFAYHRCNDGQSVKTLELRDLDASSRYIVTLCSPSDTTEEIQEGHSLMRDGLKVNIPTEQHGHFLSAIYHVQKRA